MKNVSEEAHFDIRRFFFPLSLSSVFEEANEKCSGENLLL